MTHVAFEGNLIRDPELRFTPDGKAVTNFTVAVSSRKKVGDQWQDGDSIFYQCAVWGQPAENFVASALKGTRVVVIGVLNPENYEKDGETRQSLKVNVDSVGLSTRFKAVSDGSQQALNESYGDNTSPWD